MSVGLSCRLMVLTMLMGTCSSGVLPGDKIALTPRIIGLVPIRNEEGRISFCLHALALVTGELRYCPLLVVLSQHVTTERSGYG